MNVQEYLDNISQNPVPTNKACLLSAGPSAPDGLVAKGIQLKADESCKLTVG